MIFYGPFKIRTILWLGYVYLYSSCVGKDCDVALSFMYLKWISWPFIVFSYIVLYYIKICIKKLCYAIWHKKYTFKSVAFVNVVVIIKCILLTGIIVTECQLLCSCKPLLPLVRGSFQYFLFISTLPEEDTLLI